MRTTYETRAFTFDQWAPTISQKPKRIILHRQGNPGATALNALNWGNRERRFTIHSYIGGKVCYDAIPADRHAFHVSEYRVAAARGFKSSGSYGPRGDYESIGLETEDVKGGAPGQAYSLTQETRITLLLRAAEYAEAWDLEPQDVYFHSDFDPWTRTEDLGNALNLGDFRADLFDYMTDKEPWRTVGQHASGVPAPESWRPPVENLSPPMKLGDAALIYRYLVRPSFAPGVKVSPSQILNNRRVYIVSLPMKE